MPFSRCGTSVCQASREVHEEVGEIGFKEAGDKLEKQFRKQDDTDYDGCCEVNSTVQQRESTSVGKGATKGQLILGGGIWADLESWEEAGCVTGAGGRRTDKGCSACSGMWEKARVAGARSGKSSDTCCGGRGAWGLGDKIIQGFLVTIEGLNFLCNAMRNLWKVVTRGVPWSNLLHEERSQWMLLRGMDVSSWAGSWGLLLSPGPGKIKVVAEGMKRSGLWGLNWQGWLWKMQDKESPRTVPGFLDSLFISVGYVY